MSHFPYFRQNLLYFIIPLSTESFLLLTRECNVMCKIHHPKRLENFPCKLYTPKTWTNPSNHPHSVSDLRVIVFYLAEKSSYRILVHTFSLFIHNPMIQSNPFIILIRDFTFFITLYNMLFLTSSLQKFGGAYIYISSRSID
jgi:hypothetical protein